MEYFDRALEVDPTYVEALFNKASCLIEIGKYEKSIYEFDKILSIKENNSLAMYGKSMSYAKLDKYEEAWEWWYKYLESGRLGRNVIDEMIVQIRDSLSRL